MDKSRVKIEIIESSNVVNIIEAKKMALDNDPVAIMNYNLAICSVKKSNEVKNKAVEIVRM